jgi:RHS repeat-associated protein
VCTAAGTGYTVSESVAVSGSRSLTAQAGWVNYPSSCTWTASGPGGSATFTETLTTVAGTSGSVTYIYTDGLGSPVARTDASGTVISRTRYEPYGYVASGVQPTIGFTGHVNDVDTGLTYMQQRYYDPVAGRFLSIDPVVTDANTGGSFNRYAYANNSPYKYIDPDGRAAISGEACLGICLGLTVGYSVKSGELAVTGNYGSGLGGGVSVDFRPNENGRANASDTSQGNGAVVNSYAKAGVEGSIGPLTIGAGAKGVAGTDVSTKQGFASKSEEYGVSKSEGPGKLGAKVVAGVGVEVAGYVNVKDMAKSVVSGVKDFINTANKEFTIEKIRKPVEGY